MYKHMFVERLLTMDDKKKWVRIFPKRKMQVEYVSKSMIYLRGLGGGFALRKVDEDSEWAYYAKLTDDKQEYRIAMSDYLRLRNEVPRRRAKGQQL